MGRSINTALRFPCVPGCPPAAISPYVSFSLSAATPAEPGRRVRPHLFGEGASALNRAYAVLRARALWRATCGGWKDTCLEFEGLGDFFGGIIQVRVVPPKPPSQEMRTHLEDGALRGAGRSRGAPGSPPDVAREGVGGPPGVHRPRPEHARRAPRDRAPGLGRQGARVRTRPSPRARSGGGLKVGGGGCSTKFQYVPATAQKSL